MIPLGKMAVTGAYLGIGERQELAPLLSSKKHVVQHPNATQHASSNKKEAVGLLVGSKQRALVLGVVDDPPRHDSLARVAVDCLRQEAVVHKAPRAVLLRLVLARLSCWSHQE